MGFERREFLLLTGTAAGTVAGLELMADNEYVSLDVDLDRMPMYSGDQELNANIYSHAKLSSLEELEIQVQEPEEDTWNVLDSQEASQGEAQIAIPYNPEETGEHEFRALGRTSDETYFSDIDTLKVI